MRTERPLLDRRGNTVATSSSSAPSVLFSVGTVHKEDLCDGDAAAADPLPADVVAVAAIGDVADVGHLISDRNLEPSACPRGIPSSGATSLRPAAASGKMGNSLNGVRHTDN